MKMYEIAPQIRALLESDESDELDLAQLESLEMEFKSKVQGLMYYMREEEARAGALNAEIQRLKEKIDFVNRRIDSMKAFLKMCMENAGLEKLDLVTFKVSLQNSPPSCLILDESAVPDKYKREVVTVTIDKRAIIDEYKTTGLLVEGTKVETGTHLRIR